MPFSSIAQVISQYGYGAVALAVGIESVGIPFPGETALVTAAIYAGTTHQMNIFLVIGAAAIGAIVGDNIGYWIGREFGYRLLLRYGPYVRLTERRIKLGQYAFLCHGGKVVFFGRFVSVLRTLAAVLAGANRMSWGRFFVFNVAGGIVWSTLYGTGAYLLGEQITKIAGPIGVGLFLAAVIALAWGLVIIRRRERDLEDRAERAFPGPLDR